MDDRRFDGWTRELAAAGASRRRMIAGLAGLALAGLGALRRTDEAEAQDAAVGCNGNFCAGNTQKCKGNCVCYKRLGGGAVCARSQGQCPNKGCRNDGDCKGGHVCVQSGQKCCKGQKSACAKKC
jgi:hypothetical protein